jgi:hypothetical protein
VCVVVSLVQDFGAGVDMRNDNDFGARDPTAGELGSNFGAIAIGQADTDHMLRIPKAGYDLFALQNKK